MLKNNIIPGRIILYMAGCLVIIGVIAWFSFHHGQPPAQPPSPDAKGAFQVTQAQWENLETAQAKLTLLHTTLATDGKIAANDDTTTPVFSPYTGRVTKLFVVAGDHVKRGDPLMAVAAPDFINARAQLALAIENEKRQHALYDAKTAPLKDWQQAQADLEVAKGNFRAAQLEGAGLTRSNGGDGEDVVITAPISGVVLQRQVGLGQYLNSAAGGASTPAFTIADLSTVWLLANVRETDAANVSVGDVAQVQVPAYPNRVFKVKITYVSPSLDPVTHRLPVRAEIANPGGALKPEMFASFELATDDDENAVTIPDEAIIEEGDSKHVWVADADHHLTLRGIETGRSVEGSTEVVKGLKPGETVVTGGSLFLDHAAKSQDFAPAQDSGTGKHS